MARRKDPFSKRDSKWGLNLVSTLIAWSIAAPFAIGSSLSKNTSTYDDKPISKTMAVVLIIIGIVLIPLFVPFMMYVDDTIFSIFIGIPIGIWAVIIIEVIRAFLNNESDDEDKSKQHTSITKSFEKREAIKNKVLKDIEVDKKHKIFECAQKKVDEHKQVRISIEEEMIEQERRRIMEEKCAKLRAEIEKDKEEERKRQLASFQYQYSEEREKIRKRIRKK